jgi:hypothetical protein
MNPTPIDEALNRLDGQLPLFLIRRDWHRSYIADPSRAARLLDREPQELAVLDDACRRWAAGNEWPDLDEEVRHLLYARFEQAHVFGHWICERASFPNKSAAEVLAIFLVDHWIFYGRSIWAAQIGAYANRRVA